MINDYKCPRCQSRFPSKNIILHDRICTGQNPSHLAIKLNKRNKSINKIPQSNSNLKIRKGNPPKKNNQNSESNSNLKESTFNLFSQAGEFPDIYTCEICHQLMPESEKEGHMYCHELKNQENNVHENEDEFRITQSQIDMQKEIEILIRRENEERRQQQNLLGQKRIRNENQAGNNNHHNNNRSINNQVNIMNNASEGFSGFNNNNSNRVNPSRVVRRIIPIPNGTIILHHFNSNESRSISTFNLSNNFLVNGFTLQELIAMARRINNPVSQEISIELSETKINDVSKLDQDKKECTICLEDFKNGDKTTVLPCIHLYHTSCIKNWFRTHNDCPICKFKLTRENINSQSQN